jgi:hypothetical protein
MTYKYRYRIIIDFRERFYLMLVLNITSSFYITLFLIDFRERFYLMLVLNITSSFYITLFFILYLYVIESLMGNETTEERATIDHIWGYYM